jgi:hypothetical protein
MKTQNRTYQQQKKTYQQQKKNYQQFYTVIFGAATYVFVLIVILWMHRTKTSTTTEEAVSSPINIPVLSH